MKMVMLVFNEALGEEVMEMMKSCGASNYTRINGVFGRGERSGTHLGTDVWPGRNDVLFVAVSDDEAKKAVVCVNKMRQTLGTEGIKAFVWPLDEMT